MTYFKDLSEYTYLSDMYRSGTINIGWLSAIGFETESPSLLVLDYLWDFCSISIAATRGLHFCEICKIEQYIIAEKNGIRLKLGNAEIRVFSEDGEIYAAPNLLYHYIQKHHYKPPEKFIKALLNGAKPPDPAYFRRLKNLNLDWEKTLNYGPGEGVNH